MVVSLDWIYARVALLVWASILTFASLGNVQCQWLQDNFPWWKLVVVLMAFALMHSAIWRYQIHWRMLTAVEQKSRSFFWGMVKVIVGGKIGVTAWIASFLAMGGGWFFWGVDGLVIGVIFAKITYIPYLYGVVHQGWKSIKTSKPMLLAI